MILPDINLLIHAHNLDAPRHEAARNWWDERLAGAEGVGLAWVVILGFIRITTHTAILANPWPPAEALSRVEEWLALPQFFIPQPSDNHFGRLRDLLAEVGTAGNLTTDAHLAALAIERGLILETTDAYFSIFRCLKWRNPLVK